MKGIKLIASDVDGTLVKDGTRDLNPEYLQVITQLLNRGIRVVMASGRQLPSIVSLMQPVSPRLWFIAEGGGVYRCNGKTNVLKSIPPELVKALLADIITVPDADVMLACPGKSYALKKGTEMFNWIKYGYGYEIDILGECLPDEPVVKVAMYHQVDACSAFSPELYSKWSRKLHGASAGSHWLDFTMPGIDKGAALKRIISEAGINPENVLVFGDNQNDIEMFRAAGKSLAVSNASENVRRSSTGIIPPYWENGVLQELRKLL